ncbi:alcohol dehydrogenase [Streptomyces sp. CB00316]|uniref:alcohol dehydrogenase catalytic domain-containing protein n=1 Tax=unclassified Streptomyces TaxID=2593676 RepID=UPI00093A9489|nr:MULTISPECIES: alcohol dehydrogenase catalytic domain-containing protein [unclassified Streptomyces]MBT2426362.1 alcohol dehydrogenase catalytic domain-containing protein [Streptomyces sp. ISL-112]MBT2465275.1 alcohol dehydrogenase catalytic domain-containing protein [Streptomyces sp. ISL-63]OKJ09387.1 alcohol dehydrogenase [Streptomyces sp. CB00316]
MKAAVIPAINAQWEIKEVATPRPGPGEVLIKVHACGICHNDIWVAQGVFPFPACDPAITGHEAAGEIVELGPGTTTRQVGDRVGTTWVQAACGRCSYCRRNLPLTGQSAMTCTAPVMTGLNVQGGHAEYLCVAAASTVLLPDGIDYARAAPVLCAGYTAWSALRVSEPQPHERIAVLGIGGLGHMAVQYSRACGFETVAITRSPDKHELSKSLGADLVVRDGAELREAGGADVVLVTGTSYEAATDALQGLRVGGRIVLATIDPSSSFTIGPTTPFWARGQRVLGATHNGLRYLTEALDLVAQGAVTPMIEVFPMDRIADAVDKAAKGDVRFRAVVTY